MVSQKINFRICLLYACVFSWLMLFQAVLGNAQMFNQRDDSYPLLGLKRAKNAYEVAKADYERRLKLFSDKLISREEMDRAKNAFADAEVNYQQSLLAVLFAKQFVSVQKAIKYQGRDGRKHVRLTLKNLSGSSAELRKLSNMDDETHKLLEPDDIHNVFVSLLNNDNAVVSQPYEAKIETLESAEPQTLDFALLQDLDAVTVALSYGNGSTRSPKIFLQNDESGSQVNIQARVFSLEANLGSNANYELNLDLYSRMNTAFRLEVVGLPKEITKTFLDPTTNARLTQIKAIETATTRKVTLQLYLPERTNESFRIDSTLTFFVLALPTDMAIQSDELEPNEKALQKLGLGFLRLELIPKGNGKISVKAVQLYHTVKKGEEVRVELDVLNEGTRRLDNIELKVELPFRWEKRLQPSFINSLNPSEEKKVEMFFKSPADISIGKYEARIKTSAKADGQPLSAEDKIVTLEVPAGTNVLGIILLVTLIVAAVGGLLIFGIKIIKR